MAFPVVYQRAIELGPELELCVRQPNGSLDRRRVREQLTIGRAAASDLIIDEPGVNLIHARVVPGIGGTHELRCVGGARLRVDDETVDRVTLEIGLRLQVGGVEVACERLGSQVSHYKPPSRAAERPPPDEPKTFPERHDPLAPIFEPVKVEMPRLLICPSCFDDMTGVCAVARFCPRCGSRLPARDAAGYLIPPEESSPLYPVYASLRKELEEKLANEAPQVASSLIILAYANAMLNLGWKYEHGQGALRNVEEAARCYAKAGKLSAAWGSSGGGGGSNSRGAAERA
jgi:hypothetical protein